MVETIFALATPPGRSGIAVVRISGPKALDAAAALGGGKGEARRAGLRRLRDPADGQALDDAVVLRFMGPASYTGEDVVELHLHGGPAVCRSVIGALGAMAGLRQADAGEFTRRALLNGKLDLAQVEGIGDLLAAETVAQARQAIALMDGALSAAAGQWRDGLLRALALIEVTIDFADEDVPPEALEQARALLDDIARRFEAEIAGSRISEQLREGFEVALVGAPNVGKSTLLNALAGRDAALTSEIAGTTRDLIEVRMDLGGLPVTFVDMAGLRRTADPIEIMGVERARRRADAADVRLFLLDDEADLASLEVAVLAGDVAVLSKGDLRDAVGCAAVSGKTGAGVSELLDRIGAELEGRVASAGLVNRERQRQALTRALVSVREAQARLDRSEPMAEVAAAEILGALRALDFLLGKTDAEAVLDIVFRNFCIGK